VSQFKRTYVFSGNQFRRKKLRIREEEDDCECNM